MGTTIVQDTGTTSNMNRRGRNGSDFDPAAAATKPGLGRGLAQFDLSNGQDRALIHRAIREGWKPSRRLRRDIVRRLMYLIQRSPDAQAVVSAAATLVTAAGQNLAALHRLERARIEMLKAKARALHGPQ